MAVNEKIVRRCHNKLIELAQAGRRISYGELASDLGVANQSVGHYLNAIYLREMKCNGHDLTLIPHYTGSCFGRYNSRGARPQSTVVNQENNEQVQQYKSDLRALYRHWGGQPTGELERWLEP